MKTVRVRTGRPKSHSGRYRPKTRHTRSEVADLASRLKWETTRRISLEGAAAELSAVQKHLCKVRRLVRDFVKLGSIKQACAARLIEELRMEAVSLLD